MLAGDCEFAVSVVEQAAPQQPGIDVSSPEM
jgi:hypothetical protein